MPPSAYSGLRLESSKSCSSGREREPLPCRPGAVESDNVTERTCVTRNRTRNNSATRVAGSTTLNNPLETRTKTRNSPTTVLLVLCERHAPCFGGVPSKQKREHMRSVGAPPANQQVAPVHNSGSSTAVGKPRKGVQIQFPRVAPLEVYWK